MENPIIGKGDIFKKKNLRLELTCSFLLDYFLMICKYNNPIMNM